METWRFHADESVAGPARVFAREVVRPAADDLDERDVYPVDLVDQTAERGWNAMTLPVRFGGQRATMRDTLGVFEELGAGSAIVAASLISIFQNQKIIELYGQESLKDRILPRYADGLKASFALTEKGHGSDIRSLDTKAAPAGGVSSSAADGWVLNGEKAFISAGSRADVFVVLAETVAGPTTFFVERVASGVTTRETREQQTFGLRNGPHVNLVLDNVHVPADALIGVEGKGLKQALVTLSNSRTLAAGISLGIARCAFDEALTHVANRSAFGGTIFDFQGIQWYFAEANAKLEAARLAAYQAADDLDDGRDFQRSSSIAKLLAATTATDITSMAIQVCGAMGTQTTSPFGRLLRDAKAYEIAGGSNEVLKNTIAKTLIPAGGL